MIGYIINPYEPNQSDEEIIEELINLSSKISGLNNKIIILGKAGGIAKSIYGKNTSNNKITANFIMNLLGIPLSIKYVKIESERCK